MLKEKETKIKRKKQYIVIGGLVFLILIATFFLVLNTTSDEYSKDYKDKSVTEKENETQIEELDENLEEETEDGGFDWFFWIALAAAFWFMFRDND